MKPTKFIKSYSGKHNRVSQYTGVRWSIESDDWSATLKDKGITYLCGHFADDRAAAKARDIKIISLGLNKPLQILKRA